MQVYDFNVQEYQDPMQQVAEDDDLLRDSRERRLPPIKEFQRDYRAGKASTRLRYETNPKNYLNLNKKLRYFFFSL